jgi:wzy
MTIYILLFIFIVAMLFLEVFFKYIYVGGNCLRTKDVSFYGIFFFILLVGILKSSKYGYDWDSYKNYYFDYFQGISFGNAMNSGIEPGFALLTFFLTKLGINYWLYRSIIFLISYGTIARVIRRYSNLSSLSFLLFVSFGLMTFCMFILRQAIAVAIVLLGIEQLLERKYKNYLIFVLVSCLFHYTAVIALFFIPLVWFRSINILLLRRMLYITGTIIVGEFLLPALVPLYKRNDYSHFIIRGEGKSYFIVLLFLFFIIGFLQRNQFKTGKFYVVDRMKQVKWFEVSLTTIYFQIIALYFSLFTRMVNYSLIISLVYLPNTLEFIGKKSKLFVVCYILIICMVMYYVCVLRSPLIPYISIFN